MSCGSCSRGFAVSPYSDMMIALSCPGESTSGTTVMKCAAASATTARYWAWVQKPPGSSARPAVPTEPCPPILLSRGNPLITSRKPWSSLRCRCSTLIL